MTASETLKQKTIFLTGATGLLGSYLLKTFLENGNKVYVLARDKDKKSATQRVINILKFWSGENISGLDKLTVFIGDISQNNLGLNQDCIDLLKNEVEEIFHCAASIQFNLSIDDIRKINVEGTKNVLELALLCKKLNKVNHISTAYVCGNHKGTFKENDLDLGQTFSTTYQQSKFEAENLVHEYRKKDLWIDIFRPPFIIGESSTGKIITFHAFYQAISLWANEIFDAFPGKNCYINIIPVDILTQAIIGIAYNTKAKNETYHPFPIQPVSLNEVFNMAHSIAHFKTKLIPFKDFNFDGLTAVQKIIIKNNILYFNEDVSFDSTKTNKVLRENGFVFSKIDEKILLNLAEYTINKPSTKNIKE